MGLGNFIKEPSANNYYVPPPQLPAVVFSYPNSTFFRSQSSFDKYVIIALIVLGIISLIFKAFVEKNPSTLYLVLALLTFGYLETRYKFIEIFMTPEYVTTKYGFKKIKQKTAELHNYFILIRRETVKIGARHYSYCLYLIPQNTIAAAIGNEDVLSEIYVHNKHLPKNKFISRGSKSIKKQGGIQISPNIYTPENLKEYVEGINAQLTNPLPIVFGTEQVMLDYQTGKYKAKTH